VRTRESVTVGVPLLAVVAVSLAADAPAGASLVALAGVVATTARHLGRERAAKVAMCSTAAYLLIVDPRAPVHDGVQAASELAAMAALLVTAWITPPAGSGRSNRARHRLAVWWRRSRTGIGLARRAD